MYRRRKKKEKKTSSDNELTKLRIRIADELSYPMGSQS
jgi:hypothetical protein